MIFLEFSKRFFTFYFWELECFFVLKRCFSLRPFQWYIVRLATRTGSVSNPNRRIWPYYRLLPPGRRDPHVHVLLMQAPIVRSSLHDRCRIPRAPPLTPTRGPGRRRRGNRRRRR